MGSTFISEFVPKTTEVADAFATYTHLRDRDLYERGHGGYTGSFAEVPNLYSRPASGPLTLVEAHSLANERCESGKVCKWEPAEAIPVRKTVSERKVTVSVVMTGSPSWEATWEAAAAAVKLRPGEHVAAVRIVDSGAPKRKVAVTATKGRAVTRYFVVIDERAPAWSAGFATQAEARAALADSLRRPAFPSSPFGTDRSGEVIAITRREDGAGLVEGSSVVAAQRQKAEVTIQATTGEVGGWLIYAVASC